MTFGRTPQRMLHAADRISFQRTRVQGIVEWKSTMYGKDLYLLQYPSQYVPYPTWFAGFRRNHPTPSNILYHGIKFGHVGQISSLV